MENKLMGLDMNPENLSEIVKILSDLKNKVECPICLDIVGNTVELECTHIFCDTCLSNHRLQNSPLCPICKAKIHKRFKVYKDQFADDLGKFVNRACQYIKETYAVEVTKLSTDHDKLQEIINNAPQDVCAPISNTIKKPMDNDFDNLVRRNSTRKCYTNKKKLSNKREKPKVFTDEDNRTKIINWLNANQEKLDTLTQSPNFFTDSENEADFELPSISQVPNNRKQPQGNRVRSQSLIIDNKIDEPLLKKYHSLTEGLNDDDYDIEEVHSETLVKQVERKVLQDLLEDECLANMEHLAEQATNKPQPEKVTSAKRVKTPRNKSKHSNIPNSGTSSGWDRIKDVKKSLKNTTKEPKKLYISLQECNSLQKSPHEGTKRSPVGKSPKSSKKSLKGGKKSKKSPMTKKPPEASKTVDDKENVSCPEKVIVPVGNPNAQHSNTLDDFETDFENNIDKVQMLPNNKEHSDIEIEILNKTVINLKEKVKSKPNNSKQNKSLEAPNFDDEIFSVPTQPTPQTINKHNTFCYVAPVSEEINDIDNIAVRLNDNLQSCISSANNLDSSLANALVECFTNLKTYVHKIQLQSSKKKVQEFENAWKKMASHTSAATQTEIIPIACKEVQCCPSPKKISAKYMQTSQKSCHSVEVQTYSAVCNNQGVQTSQENVSGSRTVSEESEEKLITHSISYKSCPSNTSKGVDITTKISKQRKSSSQTYNVENPENEEKPAAKKSSQMATAGTEDQEIIANSSKPNKADFMNSTQDSLLICSLGSSKKSDYKVNRKLSFGESQKRKFKRIRKPPTESDSDDEKPSKRKFVRDDLTVEFLDTEKESKGNSPAKGVDSSESENIDYDKYLLEVMNKYGTPLPLDRTSRTVNRSKVSSNENENTQNSFNFHKRKSHTSRIESQSPKNSGEHIFTAHMAFEENLDKFEKEIQEYEHTTKAHSTEYDLVENTPVLSPKPKIPRLQVSNKKKDKFKDCMKEPLQILSKGSASNTSKKKDPLDEESSGYLAQKDPSTLNQNIQILPSQTERCTDDVADILDDLRNNDDFFKSNMESDEKEQEKTDKNDLPQPQSLAQDQDVVMDNDFEDDDIEDELNKICFTAEQRKLRESDRSSVKILQDIKLKSAEAPTSENGIEGIIESSDVSDEELVETTPQKKKNTSRERSVLENIEDIDNDSLEICLPPPPGFGDDTETSPERNKSPVEPYEDRKSSLTPDTLSEFILNQDVMMLKEKESEEHDSFNQSLTFDKPSDPNLPNRSDNVAVPNNPRFPQALNISDSASPIAKSTVPLFSQTKFTPLVSTSRLSTKKPNLMTSTPNQKSILNYLRLSQENATPSKQKAMPCITWSRILGQDVNVFNQLSLRKLATTAKTFSPQVTHLVVLVDDEGRIVSHTAKMLMAIAAGIWVVRYEWAKECLKQNRIVQEDPYEALDSSGVPGPKISRLTRDTKPLFERFKFYCAPPFSTIPRGDLETILQLAGGEIAKKLEDMLQEDQKIHIILTESSASEDTEQFENLLQIYKAVTVDVEWLTRCIGQYKLVSFRPFLVSGDDSNICDLGYPSTLVESMPYTFTEAI